MDINFWYTTLGIISSVLAGMIAFWIAFVIFRMERVNEIIDMIKNDMEDQIKLKDEGGEEKRVFENLPRKYWTREDLIIEFLEPKIKHAGLDANILFDVLKERINIKKTIFKYLNINLKLIGSSIIVCLILLPFGIYVEHSPYLKWALYAALILGIAAVIYALDSVNKISRL